MIPSSDSFPLLSCSLATDGGPWGMLDAEQECWLSWAPTMACSQLPPLGDVFEAVMGAPEAILIQRVHFVFKG